MDLSDLAFWAFLAVAITGLFLPAAIAWWKGRAIVPIAVLSLVFWPGALILALRLRRRQDLYPQPSSMMSIVAPVMNSAEDPSTALPSRF